MGQIEDMYRKQMFQNRLPEVYAVEVNKIALNRDDDKRVVQKDGMSTLAHGHKVVVEASAMSVSQWF